MNRPLRPTDAIPILAVLLLALASCVADQHPFTFMVVTLGAGFIWWKTSWWTQGDGEAP